MNEQDQDAIRKVVRDQYGQVAESEGCGCGCSDSCCGGPAPDPVALAQAMGYAPDDLEAVPDGANMGLGCGNPQAIATLKLGEIVLDLGSGGGFDAFLAARQVGAEGHVIGVDMTPEMLSKARANAVKGAYSNVEFRLGEIEHLPVADASVDVILSNCVINLSPNKPQVFAEAFRVLKPGGRLAISDIVARAELPATLRESLALYAGCVAGAAVIVEIEVMLEQAGFQQVTITPKEASSELIAGWFPGTSVEDYVVSATIEARKPVCCCSGSCGP